MSEIGKRNGNPSDQDSALNKDERHEAACHTTEGALGAYAQGDQKKGDELAEKAKQMDSSAVREVMDDLNEDAGSDHSVPNKAGPSAGR
jgi:hypothetical protein